MATTKQVVETAIASSIREDRVVRIRLSDLPSGDTLADAESALDAYQVTHCTLDVLADTSEFGDVRANGEHEYWGTSDAGEWRVHVVL